MDENIESEVIGCDVCGEKHDAKNCPLVNFASHIEDQTVPSHARLSLPANLYLKDLPDGTCSVFTKEILRKGTQFGPIEAPKCPKLLPKMVFPLIIFKDDGLFDILDTSDENVCNWMGLIRHAESVTHQNLSVYQSNESMYFVAMKDIDKHYELKVGYGTGYARKINKLLGKNETPDFIEPYEDKTKANEEIQTSVDDSIADNEWICRQCKEQFSDTVLFARHLQYHLDTNMYIEMPTTNQVNHSQIEIKIKEAASSEMHVIISSADIQKYNIRKRRGTSSSHSQNETSANSGKQRKVGSVEFTSESKTIEEDDSDNNDEDADSNNLTEPETEELKGKSTSNIGNSDFNFDCEICGKHFTLAKYLKRHLKKHTGDFTCDKCDRIFGRKENLLAHTCESLITDKKDQPLEYCCTYCDKSFGVEKLLERHLVKHVGEVKCTECRVCFSTQDSYDAHECTAKLYECNICWKKFSRKIYLQKHIPIHTGQHKCNTCNKTLRSNESLQNHVKICRSIQEIDASGSTTCAVCSEVFVDGKLFRKHIHEHAHSYSCGNCGAKFRNQISLGLHVCSVSTCKGCGKKFDKISKLERHLPNCRTPYTEHTCEKCLKLFRNETVLKNHSCPGFPVENKANKRKSPQNLSRDGEKLICEVCGSMFASVSSLNTHRSSHGEKKFACKECGKRFHRKDLLQEHQSVHMEATIECLTCHKMFKTKKILEIHSLIHKDIKRFKCEQCGKSFVQKGNLKKHLETHNSEKRHECYVCQKAFSTKEYLKTHQLEHSQGKIHNCYLCGRSFLKSYQLKNHQRLLHGNQSFSCKYCGLTLKLRHSLKRHLEKKHQFLKSEWDNQDALTSMMVINEESAEKLMFISSESSMVDGNVGNDEQAKNDAEVLLAVAGFGNEALEKAIAEGKAEVRQGTIPNTIEISLPCGMEGEELTKSLVQHANINEEDSTQYEVVETEDGNHQQALKIFNIQALPSCYVSSDNGEIINSTQIVQNVVAEDQCKIDYDTGQSHEPSLTVKFQDENSTPIVIDQSNKTISASDVTFSEDGQVMLYVVTDEMEES